jgi:hypothetical protein
MLCVCRELMYDFFNRHFALGISAEAIVEQDYVPLSYDEATVWCVCNLVIYCI